MYQRSLPLRDLPVDGFQGWLCHGPGAAESGGRQQSGAGTWATRGGSKGSRGHFLWPWGHRLGALSSALLLASRLLFPLPLLARQSAVFLPPSRLGKLVSTPRLASRPLARSVYGELAVFFSLPPLSSRRSVYPPGDPQDGSPVDRDRSTETGGHRRGGGGGRGRGRRGWRGRRPSLVSSLSFFSLIFLSSHYSSSFLKLSLLFSLFSLSSLTLSERRENEKLWLLCLLSSLAPAASFSSRSPRGPCLDGDGHGAPHGRLRGGGFRWAQPGSSRRPSVRALVQPQPRFW